MGRIAVIVTLLITVLIVTFWTWRNARRPTQHLTHLNVSELLLERTRHPQDPAVHHALARQYADMERYDEALASFRQSLSLRPSSEVWNDLGVMFKAMGRNVDAISAFGRAIALDRKFWLAYRNRAIAYASSTEYDYAAADYQKAIELRPREWLLHLELAAVYAHNGRTREAIRVLNKYVTDGPGDAEGYALLADLYTETSRLDDAVRAARKALDLDPHHPQAYLTLARVAQKRVGKGRDLPAALRYLQQAERAAPPTADVYREQGLVLLELHRTVEAVTAFEQALRINPDDYDTFYGLGRAYTALNRLDDAQRALARFQKLRAYFTARTRYHVLLQSEPNNFDVRLRLARLERSMGKDLAAAQQYELLLTLKKDDPTILKELALCYEKQGEHDRAAALRETAGREEGKEGK
jgi:tetratricopeptide (TPR) repeat protein